MYNILKRDEQMEKYPDRTIITAIEEKKYLARFPVPCAKCGQEIKLTTPLTEVIILKNYKLWHKVFHKACYRS